MNREALISGVVALGCHALLLFGLRLGNGAHPLPVEDSEVEVSLVEAAPPAPAAPVADVAPPPAAEPVIEPPAEVPLEPTPEPRPTVTRPPAPRPLVPRPAAPTVPKPASPGARGAAVSGTGNSTVSASTGLGNAQPRYRSNPRPEYPAEARRLRQQGRVLLDVAVSAGGRPTSVSVKQSSGVASLDAAALAAVRRWTFEPARTAGIAVAARVEVPVRFDLAR